MRSKVRVPRSSIERLIALVREHRIVYDTSHPDRRDASWINVWDNIAYQMNIPDVDGMFWKNRWRSLRDMYVKKKKVVRYEKDEQKVEKAKRWNYYKMMGFLDNFTKEEDISIDFGAASPEFESESTGDMPYEFEILNDEDADDPCIMVKSDPEDVSNLHNTPGCVEQFPMYRESSDKRFIRRHIKREWPDYTLHSPEDPLDMVPDHKVRREVPGGHYSIPQMSTPYGTMLTSRNMADVTVLPTRSVADAFFESCAMRMKNLPQMAQACLMLQIQQLFFNAENPSLPNVPITPLPDVMNGSVSDHGGASQTKTE